MTFLGFITEKLIPVPPPSSLSQLPTAYDPFDQSSVSHYLLCHNTYSFHYPMVAFYLFLPDLHPSDPVLKVKLTSAGSACIIYLPQMKVLSFCFVLGCQFHLSLSYFVYNIYRVFTRSGISPGDIFRGKSFQPLPNPNV